MLKAKFGNGFQRSGIRLALGGVAASLIVGVVGVGAMAASPPKSGPAENGSPAWYIWQPPANNAPRPPQTPLHIAQCAAESAKFCSGQQDQERNCLAIHYTSLSSTCQAAVAASAPQAAVNDRSGVPTCIRSVICGPNNGQGIAWRTNPNGVLDGVGGYIRVLWKSVPENMGYTPSYPYKLPEGAGGAVGIAVDSKDNLWVYQRSPVGVPSLTKFGPDRKMLFTLGDDVIGHSNKAHGMNVDAEGNAYIADPSSSIIQKISPDGKVLKVIGERGHRGDWDEAKGQRLLWQPISLTFAANGDMYIGEGHANESPNDTQSGDPTNISGASRVIHLDKDGKFINQWYGNVTGPGKFAQVHDLAVDPKTGDVWLGDRELYRIVIYSSDGEFIRAIQMRNLTCNIAFDKNGDPWIGTGGDGQLVKIDRNGKVLEAVGNGPGNGEGQVGETGYIRWDSKGNMYMGATSQPRVTVWTPPRKG